MKLWKRNLVLSAIPIAAITVGCVAAQDDLGELARQDITHRWGCLSHPNLAVEIVEVGPSVAERLDDDDYEDRAEAAVEMWLAGELQVDDFVLSAITNEQIGVAFGVDEGGTANPCQLNVPQGSAALGAVSVSLRGYDTNAPGEMMVMNQQESEEACGNEAGFFFVEDESGPFGTIAMCPSSCDALAGSAAEGGTIAVEVILNEV